MPAIRLSIALLLAVAPGCRHARPMVQQAPAGAEMAGAETTGTGDNSAHRAQAVLSQRWKPPAGGLSGARPASADVVERGPQPDAVASDATPIVPPPTVGEGRLDGASTAHQQAGPPTAPLRPPVATAGAISTGSGTPGPLHLPSIIAPAAAPARPSGPTLGLPGIEARPTSAIPPQTAAFPPIDQAGIVSESRPEVAVPWPPGRAAATAGSQEARRLQLLDRLAGDSPTVRGVQPSASERPAVLAAPEAGLVNRADAKHDSSPTTLPLSDLPGQMKAHTDAKVIALPLSRDTSQPSGTDRTANDQERTAWPGGLANGEELQRRARRQIAKEAAADRAARERLNQSLYKLLLGDGMPRTATRPTPPPVTPPTTGPS